MAMPTFLPRHPPAHVGRAGCSACAARCPQDLLGSQGQRTLSPSLSPTLSQHRLVMGFTGLLSTPSNPPLGSEELGGVICPLAADAPVVTLWPTPQQHPAPDN